MSFEENRLGDERGRLAALDRYRLRRPSEGGGTQFQSITDLVADLFGVSICTISIINEDVQYFAAVTGVEPGLTPRSESVCSRTIEGHGPLVVDDLTADLRFADASFVTDERHFRSYAGVPLTTPDGYNLGSLCVIDRQTREFSGRELVLLDRFAKLVVEQMELRTIAHQDFLTGALSRRAFTEKSSQVLASEATAALLAFDVDHFKRINDVHGHASGDRVLRAIADGAAALVRDTDELGRIGGEEFAILLRQTSPAEAMRMAERLRTEIENMTLPHGEPVTASFGVAMAQTGEGFEAWLARADGALYEAKRTGRNRSVLADAHREAA